MLNFVKIISIFLLFFVISCSSSYEKLSKSTFEISDPLSNHLFNEYKNKAEFEAQKMHDWNSAKLYSEKALLAAQNKEVLPQKISYWKIDPNKKLDLIKGYNNLMIIYEDSVLIDPLNLAKAISSIDCWSEQQEEKWQTWDINLCKDELFNCNASNIYDSVSKI